MGKSQKEVLQDLAANMWSWRKIENASVASTGRVIEKTENDIVRLIMEIIQRDSQMHYRVQEWIAETLQGKTCLVSGSGNVAQYTCEKLLQLGAKPLTLSDSSGYIYDEAGIDADKPQFVMDLKNVRRGRIKEYADKYKGTVYTSVDASQGYNPLWNHKADCAFPSATQNEINGKDAQNLLDNGVYVVSEGANMPTTADGVELFLDAKILCVADHVEAIYQGEPSGSNAGCVGPAEVYDLVGNVEEWTRRRDGGVPDFHGSLKGRYWAESRTCQSRVTTHGDYFRFYEIGFRCCLDVAE